MWELTEEELKGLLILAGFQILNKWQIKNGYLGWSHENGEKVPFWWLVKTQFGLIRIGWRKRVLAIEWEDFAYRGFVTEDDVTKGESDVHAYSMVKALEYLTSLRKAAEKEAKAAQPTEEVTP